MRKTKTVKRDVIFKKNDFLRVTIRCRGKSRYPEKNIMSFPSMIGRICASEICLDILYFKCTEKLQHR